MPSKTGLKLLPFDTVEPSIAVDYHMHTLHTDGTDTPLQMVEAAVGQGLTEVLLSEHVRHTSTYYPSFAGEVRALHCPGLTIHVGIETKVLDIDGCLDCSPQIASICDAIVGAVHSPPSDSGGMPGSWAHFDAEAAQELEFQLALAIVTKSKAHILAHPMGMVVTRFGLQPLDHLYQLACACLAFDKAFELNPRYCSSPQDWIDIVRRAGCKVSFGSDAHKASDVGRAWRLFIEENREENRNVHS